eukprot:3048452-Pleurochrysis_carterae.AAC.1
MAVAALGLSLHAPAGRQAWPLRRLGYRRSHQAAARPAAVGAVASKRPHVCAPTRHGAAEHRMGQRKLVPTWNCREG